MYQNIDRSGQRARDPCCAAVCHGLEECQRHLAEMRGVVAESPHEIEREIRYLTAER